MGCRKRRQAPFGIKFWTITNQGTIRSAESDSVK
jgi:hypothetical protein